MIFGIFRNLFWVCEDFINKNGFQHWIQGFFHSQIRCTDFKSSKKSLLFWEFFRNFRIFLGVYEDYFEWTTPRNYVIVVATTSTYDSLYTVTKQGILPWWRLYGLVFQEIKWDLSEQRTAPTRLGRPVNVAIVWWPTWDKFELCSGLFLCFMPVTISDVRNLIRPQ